MSMQYRICNKAIQTAKAFTVKYAKEIVPAVWGFIFVSIVK
jgi:hypothetical protein